MLRYLPRSCHIHCHNTQPWFIYYIFTILLSLFCPEVIFFLTFVPIKIASECKKVVQINCNFDEDKARRIDSFRFPCFRSSGSCLGFMFLH